MKIRVVSWRHLLLLGLLSTLLVAVNAEDGSPESEEDPDHGDVELPTGAIDSSEQGGEEEVPPGGDAPGPAAPSGTSQEQSEQDDEEGTTTTQEPAVTTTTTDEDSDAQGPGMPSGPTESGEEGDTTQQPQDTTTTEPEPARFKPRYNGLRWNNHTVSACEGDLISMTCPQHYYISVMSVFWGRGDHDICKYAGYDTENCGSNITDAEESVVRRCHGKQSCTIAASVSILGNPCEDITYKYLLANYYCERAVNRGVACANDGPMSISCGAGRYIKIAQATYGRPDDDNTCAYGSDVSGATCGTDVTVELQQLCAGHEECTINPQSDLFVTTCEVASDYLKFSYTCDECVNVHSDDAACLYWALSGDCESNSVWMQANCRKACRRCGDYTPACENLYYNDTLCYTWGDNGMCDSEGDAAWMSVYCRKACVQCDSVTPCENSQWDSKCDGYMEDNSLECSENPNWMLRYCTKSCFPCSGGEITCEDHDSGCRQWAADGYCHSNPGYMIPYCTKSCLSCDRDPACKNEYTNTPGQCDFWASIGECETNPIWMHRHCWKSCLKCGPPSECENAYGDDAQCEQWADSGECVINEMYMMAHCKKACTSCDMIKCDNLYTDSICEERAANGRCDFEPVEMFRNCYRSCQKCDQPSSNLYDEGICEYWAWKGECDANPAWMRRNCYSSCTRRDINSGFKLCADVSTTNCSYWRDNGDCSYNPWWMLKHCAASCTGCDAQSNSWTVGEPARPGQVVDVTRGSSVILRSQRFTRSGRLTAFSAFWAGTDPVYLQIWEYNQTVGYKVARGWLVRPKARGMAEKIWVNFINDCFDVRKGDMLGFTVIGGVSPVAGVEDPSALYSLPLYRDTGTSQSFSPRGTPYRFSLMAHYDLKKC